MNQWISMSIVGVTAAEKTETWINQSTKSLESRPSIYIYISYTTSSYSSNTSNILIQRPMDSDSEIAYDYPRYKVYKNGRIERLVTDTFVPPSLTPDQNGVVSKDAVYSPEKNLSPYLPPS